MMRLLGVDRQKFAHASTTVRLSGTFTSRSGERCVWVEVPMRWASALDDSADAWLAFLCILAALEHEDVTIEGMPVDPLLYHGLEGALDLLTNWYRPHFIKRPTIRVQLRPDDYSGHHEPRMTGQFFTGGIDSLHTALRHGQHPDRRSGARYSVNALVRVLHDIPLSSLHADDAMLRSIRLFALATEREVIPVSTNAMVLSPRLQDAWVSASFAMTFAFVAHALAGSIERMVVAASMTTKHLQPDGTHPLLLAACSSSKLEIVPDTLFATRLEKTSVLGESSAALRTIEVCDRATVGDDGVHNCSRCRKCLRTMITLDLLGLRNASHTFDWSSYTPEQYGQMHFDQIENWFANDIVEEARRCGRNDIVNAVTNGQRRAAFRQPINLLVQGVRRTALAQRYKPTLKHYKDSVCRRFGLRTNLD